VAVNGTPIHDNAGVIIIDRRRSHDHEMKTAVLIFVAKYEMPGYSSALFSYTWYNTGTRTFCVMTHASKAFYVNQEAEANKAGFYLAPFRIRVTCTFILSVFIVSTLD
jgi:hypothetical protein